MAAFLPDPPRPPLVLVVEDDADTREMYGAILGLSGLRVVQSARGEDALTKARTLRPDIVTTDVGLQGIDGYQVCERLKRHPRTSSIPVIMVTGWATSEHLDRARRAGCDALLVKPCTPDVLLEEINRLLNLRPIDDSGEM